MMWWQWYGMVSTMAANGMEKTKTLGWGTTCSRETNERETKQPIVWPCRTTTGSFEPSSDH
ncbi:hypothetical protein OUZ56_008324 [Daphnia magna]|uniref:Uncharacterized protein n=1 Tax=Daphnia magna TaxID=35525 RepID=A0ABR0ACL9_9CRUS|nr:hypothetical protein OUZ56_008324 [Daphnia magna]